MRMTSGRIASTRSSSRVGTISSQSSSLTRLLSIADSSRAKRDLLGAEAAHRAARRARPVGDVMAQQVVGAPAEPADVAAGVLGGLADRGGGEDLRRRAARPARKRCRRCAKAAGQRAARGRRDATIDVPS